LWYYVAAYPNENTKLVPANLGNQMHLLAQLFLFKLLRELKQNEYFLLASSYSLKKSISGEFSLCAKVMHLFPSAGGIGKSRKYKNQSWKFIGLAERWESLRN